MYLGLVAPFILRACALIAHSPPPRAVDTTNKAASGMPVAPAIVTLPLSLDKEAQGLCRKLSRPCYVLEYIIDKTTPECS
jgi:hypothetical protein